MQVHIKAKLLRYFLSENRDKGFTKMGWLVRIFLYGSVAATLSFPYYNHYRGCSGHNWFAQVNCSRASEAKQYIGSMNRAQQAYYLEKGTFANFKSFNDLGLGINTETDSYSYRILSPMVPVQSLNESEQESTSLPTSVTMVSQKKGSYFNQYIGSVFVTKTKENNEDMTIAVICEVKGKNSLPTSMPKLVNGEAKCPEGSEAIR